MSELKRFWPPKGSLFAAVLDTAVAIWCFTTALRHHERIELWVLSTFFGSLALWEWHAYLGNDKESGS